MSHHYRALSWKELLEWIMAELDIEVKHLRVLTTKLMKRFEPDIAEDTEFFCEIEKDVASALLCFKKLVALDAEIKRRQSEGVI